jgi:hypothetical protein
MSPTGTDHPTAIAVCSGGIGGHFRPGAGRPVFAAGSGGGVIGPRGWAVGRAGRGMEAPPAPRARGRTARPDHRAAPVKANAPQRQGDTEGTKDQCGRKGAKGAKTWHGHLAHGSCTHDLGRYAGRRGKSASVLPFGGAEHEWERMTTNGVGAGGPEGEGGDERQDAKAGNAKAERESRIARGREAARPLVRSSSFRRSSAPTANRPEKPRQTVTPATQTPWVPATPPTLFFPRPRDKPITRTRTCLRQKPWPAGRAVAETAVGGDAEQREQ